jgi:hypothetical protein
MMALMSLSAVKDITQFPGAISRFERDVKLYERRAGRSFPEEFKIPTVLRLLPKSHERELKLKFAMGLTDYRELTQQIMGYSPQIRFEGAYSGGDNDMDVGALEAWESFIAQASVQEVAAFYEGIQAGVSGEDVPLCAPCEDQDGPLDALYRKGKGKGKRGKGYGGSTADSGKGNRMLELRAVDSLAPAPVRLLHPERRICACATGASRRATS